MFVHAENTGKGFITHEDHNNGLSFQALRGNLWKVGGPAEAVTAWMTRVSGTEVLAATMLETAKSIKEDEIYARAREVLDTAVSRYSYGETAVWRDLEREAAEYQATATVGDLMRREIDNGQGAGRAAPEISTTVLTMAESLHNLRAAVISNRSKHVAAVKALTTAQGVLDYDASSGWPALG